MNRRRVSQAIVPLLLGMTTGVASASSIRDYTLITLGDYSAQVEVEGSAFIGGDIVGGGPIFGSNTSSPGGESYIPDGGPALKLAGNIAANVNQVTLNGLGEAFVNANVAANQRGKFVTNGNRVVFDPGLAAERAQLASQMTGASAALAMLRADSVATIRAPQGQPGPLVFDVAPGGDGVAVFHIDGALLDSRMVQQIEFRGTASTIIVNVSGTRVTASGNFVGGLLSNPAFQATTLFNFFEATSLDIRAGIAGAVLAPMATVNIASTTEGAVFANVVVQNGGEIHGPNYAGFLPSAVVPEPATLTMLAMGLPAIVAVARLRRRRVA